MTYVHKLIAKLVVFGLKRSDVITERNFKLTLRPEHDLTNTRVKPVSTYYQIELIRTAAFKGDPDAAAHIVDAFYRISEHRPDTVIERFKDRC